MAETSRSQFTITLGRTGQVVKRAGPILDSGFSDSKPVVGSKRSVRDRLGSAADGFKHNNKRQRAYCDSFSMSSCNGFDAKDARLGKDDLRFKLTQRSKLGRVQIDVQRNGMDLRQMLSGAIRPSTNSVSMRHRMPDRTDSRHLLPEQKDVSILGQNPYTRSAEALPRMNSLRNSYSPWTLDRIRRRSPDIVSDRIRRRSPDIYSDQIRRRSPDIVSDRIRRRSPDPDIVSGRIRRRSPDIVSHASRNLSPQRNAEDIMQRPLTRTYDDARTVSYLRRDIFEPGRPLGSASYTRRPKTVAAPVKPVVPPLVTPQMSGIAYRSSYSGNEHLSVDGFLRSLGLERYAIPFKAEEVDMAALRQMGDNDLKAMGIPMGPRKKILLALLPRSKRPL